MYLARFALDDLSYVQGVARVQYARCDAARDAEILRRQLQGCAASLLALSAERCAFRICLSEKGALAATYLVMTQGRDEAALRRALASFSRLEPSLRGTLDLPTSREQFDQIAAEFPEYQALVEPSRQQAHRAALSCDFRLARSLETMFEAAWLGSMAIGYQLQTMRIGVPRATLRAALRNLEDLERAPGRPDDLMLMQRELVRKLSGPIVLCEELLGARNEEESRWLADFVSQQFASDFGRLRLLPPLVQFGLRAFEDELTTATLHAVQADSRFDDICSAIMTEDERSALLAWTPTNVSAFNLVEPPVPLGDLQAPDTPRPIFSPPAPQAPYLFVSYARKDGEQVRRFVEEVERCGYAVWFDEHIPGGSEWDAVLEERIAGARAVLLFLSNHSVQSRYVRREVKFADAIGKMILCLQLEETKLEHGLALLLSSNQLLRADIASLRRNLHDAIGPSHA